MSTPHDEAFWNALDNYDEQFAERVKREAAYGLFREGAISSGVAARWLGIPRAVFLLDAMRHGATRLWIAPPTRMDAMILNEEGYYAIPGKSGARA